MSKRIGRKRLAVDIPEVLHAKIAQQARQRNITITKWIVRATWARIRWEEQFLQEEGWILKK